MRIWSIAALAAGGATLAGCAMPAAVQVAMMAGSAVSVGATGKGLSDHAVSALTDEDCSVLHIFDGRDYCVAAADRENGVTVAIAPLASDALPVERVEPAAGRASAGPALFVVIGSFLNPAYAEAARQQHADMPIHVAPAHVHGKDWLRVLAGPYDAGHAAAARRRLADAGVADSWSLRLCSGSLMPPPCGVSGG
ncbi:MAG: SPOR domain-containing protein [Alphaproteobacteria bacterium]